MSLPRLLRAALPPLIALLAVAAPARAGFPSGDGAFHTHAETTAELRAIAAAHPAIAAVIRIGTSYEGRAILGLRISDHVGLDEAEPEVVVTGLTHAREHITVEASLALAHWLTDGYRHDARITRLVEGREITIIPMVNPDGGEADIRGGRYHSWRKNMQPDPGGAVRSIGTDLNRNFGYRWGRDGGSSGDPRSEQYRGPRPFSAPETRALRSFIVGRVVDGSQQVRVMVNLHSYGQQVLYPYGYTRKDVPSDMARRDHEALRALARGAAARARFTAMQASDLYPTSGSANDWAYGTQRILSFTIEMSPREGDPRRFYLRGRDIPGAVGRVKGALLYLVDEAACPYAAAGDAAACAGLPGLVPGGPASLRPRSFVRS